MTIINDFKYVGIMNNDPRFKDRSSRVKSGVIDAFRQSNGYNILTRDFHDKVKVFETKSSRLDQNQNNELDLYNKLKVEKIILFDCFLKTYVIPGS